MLTARERQALEMAADGHRGKVIADGMGVCVKWVDTLLFRARKKLGARNTAQAVVIAMRAGVIK